jgi:hypothetical protein
MDLQGIIPCRSHDFEYQAYHILRLVIITAQIVEIAGFVILVRVLNISHFVPYISIRQISVTFCPFCHYATAIGSPKFFSQLTVLLRPTFGSLPTDM